MIARACQAPGGVEGGSGERGGTRFMVGGGRPKADHVGFLGDGQRVAAGFSGGAQSAFLA